MRAAISRRRMVAIEFGMWRSVLSGRTSWSAISGKGRFFEQRGGTRPRGGNRLPFGDQESISRDTQTGVVMEAAPSASFKVSKADLLLKLKIVALDPPTKLRRINQAAETDVCRQC